MIEPVILELRSGLTVERLYRSGNSVTLHWPSNAAWPIQDNDSHEGNNDGD